MWGVHPGGHQWASVPRENVRLDEAKLLWSEPVGGRSTQKLLERYAASADEEGAIGLEGGGRGAAFTHRDPHAGGRLPHDGDVCGEHERLSLRCRYQRWEWSRRAVRWSDPAVEI